VLVVDDEPAVRTLLAHLLRTKGYDVHEAEDGAAALAWLDQPARRVDLVVADVVMPGMSGIELAEAIGARWPDLKVLFVSGYPQDAARTSGPAADIPVLSKPFTPSRIASAVRAMLDGLPAAG
jgi:CheY-like chemotaxis protein